MIRNGTVELIGVDNADSGSAVPTAGLRKPAHDAGVIRAAAETSGPRPTATTTLPKAAAESKPSQAASSHRGNEPALNADLGVAILRDVDLRIEPGEKGLLHFEGLARGDLFGKLSVGEPSTRPPATWRWAEKCWG